MDSNLDRKLYFIERLLHTRTACALAIYQGLPEEARDNCDTIKTELADWESCCTPADLLDKYGLYDFVIKDEVWDNPAEYSAMMLRFIKAHAQVIHTPDFLLVRNFSKIVEAKVNFGGWKVTK